jgi:hypothetical protein
MSLRHYDPAYLCVWSRDARLKVVCCPHYTMSDKYHSRLGGNHYHTEVFSIFRLYGILFNGREELNLISQLKRCVKDSTKATHSEVCAVGERQR